MREKRFVAIHRGGLLTIEQHKMLMRWACTCAEKGMSLSLLPGDERLVSAINTAREWEKGNVSVAEARNASVRAHGVARESEDPVIIAVARSVGHAVATAHMSDHSLGAAMYALKAVKLIGMSAEEERKWQNDQIPQEMKEFIIFARSEKEKHFRI